MARTGQYSGPTELYGVPLSVIHPPDNDVQSSKYFSGLKDPSLNLTEEQMNDLQQQILELTALMKLGRDVA